MHRRQFIGGAAAVTAGLGLLRTAGGQICPAKTGTVRDKLWVFCNPVNADYGIVRGRSVMSPLESAVYLGVPNIIMANQYPRAGEEGWYKPWESPFELYAFPMKVLKRVSWSIVGASGVTKESERKEVIAMAQKTPNFVGVYMDDFFEEDGAKGSLTIDELRSLQQQLKSPDKKLDLYVTLYTRALNRPLADYLGVIDVITLWTWETSDLANLDANLAKLEKLAPKARIMLGCYTAANDPKATPAWTPLPVPIMKRQCDLGLRWLREGRIEGIIVYGNFMDLNWDSVEWAREWVERVGETKL
jgi:hypothetical protein